MPRALCWVTLLCSAAAAAAEGPAACNATLQENWSAGAVVLAQVPAAGVEACCAACVANPSCLIFVLHGDRCYLKGDSGSSHAKSGNTAGYVRVMPAPTPPSPATAPPTPLPKGVPKFELVQALNHPVISSAVGKDQYHINNGFEGGLYTKTDDGMYHLFPTECMSDMPGVAWDIHTESHHWTSPDGINNWTMGELTYNSSAKQDGTDRRAAIFAPMNIYDEDEGRWNIFYIGYTCQPGQKDGAIYRVVSQSSGKGGIGGPYPPEKATIILDEEMGDKQSWEGYQGTDSFHAWQLDNGTWMGFYGSHGGNSPGAPPCSKCEWQVGLITAPKLAGPWTRCPSLSPASYIENPEGIENPIVTRTIDRSIEHTYVAVYDALMPDQIHGHSDYVGISQSADGVHWSPAQYVSLNASASKCGSPVRTPQGLVPEPGKCKGCYSMLYTGIDGGYRNECWVLLRNTAEL